MALLFVFCMNVTAAQRGIALSTKLKQPGWMRDGWGTYDTEIHSDLSFPIKLTSWTAHWEAKKAQIGESWGGPLDVEIPAGGTIHRVENAQLPAKVLAAAGKGTPRIVGSYTFLIAGSDLLEPFQIDVPEAVLPEPLHTITGRTVAISVMNFRFKDFKNPKRALGWIDQCYQAMIEFTGEQPFGGRIMAFTEAPEHPWWAYSGERMILNTKFVGSTLKDFDEGILSFGWVHEVGHNFDEKIGDWYIWNGPSAEFQANFKLAYAVSSIPDQSFRIRWKTGAPDYVPQNKESLVSGPHLVSSFFLQFGDAYLSDPKKNWQDMSSDDIQCLFQRLQVIYGWRPFKRWYRTYRLLQDSGLKPPDKPEEKISLAVAVLSRETGNDLTPVFQMWRMPVTSRSVADMKLRYLIH